MDTPLLLDLSHTCHTRARTGIQRVTRSLHAALGVRALAVTYDPYQETWRRLQDWERENLVGSSAAAKRGARWPISVKLRGRTQRWLGQSDPSLPSNSGLIVPEVFSPAVAAALPQVFSATTGPRVALFHDAIALKYPELTPAKTVARFPAYLLELVRFDGIAAVSEDSRQSLGDYWRWLGIKNPPPIKVIPLGTDPQPLATIGEDSPAAKNSIVLSVGTIEGRKNHLALLEASERLWAEGASFSLHLIGLAHPQTGASARAKIAQLQAAGRPVRYDGPVADAALGTAYRQCAFTVYPSLIEGFGLPVIESLSHGKPCICSGRGALGESANGGGCITLDCMDAASIATAMRRLLTDPQEMTSLRGAARSRQFTTWDRYADDLTAWIRELARREANL